MPVAEVLPQGERDTLALYELELSQANVPDVAPDDASSWAATTQIGSPAEYYDSPVIGEERHVEAGRQAAEVLLPRAVRVQDLSTEAAIQKRHAQGLGRIAIGSAGERRAASPETGSITGMLDAIDEAARGNTGALERNIVIASDEALTTEGILDDIIITRDADGALQQGGQKLSSVVENAIRLHPGDHPGLHEVTLTVSLEPETIDELDAAGLFDSGHILIIPRMAPTHTPGRSIRQYGHFENLAVAWNLIWKTGPNEFKLRPMFTAGVVPLPGEESQNEAMSEVGLDTMYEERLKRRHDIAAVSGMYDDSGLPVPDTVTGFLRGYLMHRSQFKDPDHPELDVAEHYDAKLGPDFFLGRTRRPEDVGYLEDSRKRIEALKGLREYKQLVVQALIKYRHTFSDDLAAARCMAKLVENLAIDYVYDNPQFLQVLGPSLGAAAYNAIINGGGRAEVRRKARVNTCGYGSDGATTGDDTKDQLGTGDNREGHSDDDQDCAYTSKECPLCGEKNVWTIDEKLLTDTNGRKWRVIRGLCKKRCMLVYEKKV